MITGSLVPEGKNDGQKKNPSMFHPLRPGTICAQPDQHRYCYKRNLGRELRDRAKSVWAFPNATIPPLTETRIGNTVSDSQGNA